MNVDEAYNYCRAIAHRYGANFSVGFRFLPRQKRRAVYAAYAWCRWADDIADEEESFHPEAPASRPNGQTSGIASPLIRPSPTFSPLPWGEGLSMPPAVKVESPSPPRADVGEKVAGGRMRGPDAEIASSNSTAARLQKLDDWQRELDAAYSGSPSHPITIALGDALKHFSIPKSAFIALVDGCRQDMVKTRYETFAELLHYCELVASSISDISLAIFGYRSDAAIEYGRNLATALQLTNVTRDIGDDLTRDRVYVPHEELRRFGVAESELFAHAANERVRALIEFEIDRAESYFKAAEPLLRELSFDARFPVLLMGGVYATVLAKLRKDPLMVIRQRLSLTTLQKAMVVGARVLRPHFV